tara:strand:+ start:206 stop:433 length:228 start_codon:yes stop_codon:yes gene_type:complete
MRIASDFDLLVITGKEAVLKPSISYETACKYIEKDHDIIARHRSYAAADLTLQQFSTDITISPPDIAIQNKNKSK